MVILASLVALVSGLLPSTPVVSDTAALLLLLLLLMDGTDGGSVVDELHVQEIVDEHE